MNKRQAKKQFKKKYGCNPSEFVCSMDAIAEGVRKMCDDINNAMPVILKEISETVNNIIEDVNKFVQSDEFKKIAGAISDLEEKDNIP